ncbi:MAG: N-acetylmuramoyl-L-alanine amidase [Saprospiraceae bacterium]|nr:N-acetylmuramoyl-L-alanine amidase [Lewinella sp.]
MNTDFCVFLDAGHGSIDPKTGKYVTAPSKQYEHSKGTFHDGRWFFEGVWNRVLTDRVAKKLDTLQINYIKVYHEYLDMSLSYRVDTANWYNKYYKKTLFISNHSNASGSGAARGFEVYTSPGTTRSDKVATAYFNNVKEIFGSKISYRQDATDGDPDREAKFYVLRNTAMSAILGEHLFFDNFEDASLLMLDETVERFAEAQLRTIVEFWQSM